MISRHLDKNNLHHAYLIEGERDVIVSEILNFCENLNIKTSGNPDFCHIIIDNFKIDEAFYLRAMSSDKSFVSTKKIFLICANSFSLDAQNVLLKMFEEPIENTHFFLVIPDINSLLKTLISRFYLISIKQGLTEEIKDAEKFINMSFRSRLDFLKELLVQPEEDADLVVGVPSGTPTTKLDSARSKALKFLNALELILHKKLVFKDTFDTSFFEHFFKVREFLRMPGSSPKTLVELVALIVPRL